MENNSMLMRILMFIGFLFVAGIILNLVLGIAGSLIAFVFLWDSPINRNRTCTLVNRRFNKTQQSSLLLIL